MFKSAVLFAVVMVCSTMSFAKDDFPKGPDASVTPGALCDSPDSYRYPEHIKYCSRDVSSGTKREIFVRYDQMGYRTRSMNRQDFKIDHYIPLYAGGSNDERNLWPQHKSIYVITDDLEALVCEKMAEGRLKQKDAVNLIIQAKNHLDEVPDIEAQVRALKGALRRSHLFYRFFFLSVFRDRNNIKVHLIECSICIVIDIVFK